EAGQGLLLVKRGPNAGSTFLLEQPSTSAGRSADSDVFLDDVTVSRKHAIFERRADGSWFIRDVGSLNGTYVNGEQVDETKLASGELGGGEDGIGGGEDGPTAVAVEIADAPTGLQMSIEEMSAATGVERERIRELESFGIVCSHGPVEARYYDGDDYIVLSIV